MINNMMTCIAYFFDALVPYLIEKILMLFITILEIIIASTFYFCAKNAALYIISVLLVSACIGGHFAILSPVFNKIFGLERGPEMYGVTGNFIGIASICGPIFTNFILNDTPYFLVVFLVGGGLCIIKLIGFIHYCIKITIKKN